MSAQNKPAEDPCYPPCDDSDHEECAILKCPYHEPLHNHHDGCPACWGDEAYRNQKP
jgi:hypothetical protein